MEETVFFSTLYNNNVNIDKKKWVDFLGDKNIKNNSYVEIHKKIKSLISTLVHLILEDENNPMIKLNFCEGQRIVTWLNSLKLGCRNGITLEATGPTHYFIDKWNCRRLHAYESAMVEKAMVIVWERGCVRYLETIRDIWDILLKHKKVDQDYNLIKMRGYLAEKQKAFLSFVLNSWLLFVKHKKENIYFFHKLKQMRKNRLGKVILNKWFLDRKLYFSKWKKVIKKEKYWLGRTFGNWRYYVLTSQYSKRYSLNEQAHSLYSKMLKKRCLSLWKNRNRGSKIIKLNSKFVLECFFSIWINCLDIWHEIERENMRFFFRYWQRLIIMAYRHNKKSVAYFTNSLLSYTFSKILFSTRILKRKRNIFVAWYRVSFLFKPAAKAMLRWCRKVRIKCRIKIAFKKIYNCDPINNGVEVIEHHDNPMRSPCRCIRCSKKYGHLGASPNRLRGSPDRSGIVVSESNCSLDEHLFIRLYEGKKVIDKGLKMRAKSSRNVLNKSLNSVSRKKTKAKEEKERRVQEAIDLRLMKAKAMLNRIDTRK